MTKFIWRPEDHTKEENMIYINGLLLDPMTEKMGYVLLKYCTDKHLV